MIAGTKDVPLSPLASVPESRRSVVAAIRGALVAGTYRVQWQMAAPDAHPTRGSFTFAAWLHLGSVPALWRTDYGRLLLLKVAVLSVVALTGAYNWLKVRPILGDMKGAHRIRRSSTVELSIAVVVLLVTAVLVATPTAMDVEATATFNGKP